MNWRKIMDAAAATLLMLLLTLSPIVTHPAVAAREKKRSAVEPVLSVVRSGKLSEVAPPSVVGELRQAFDNNKPQVSILSPRANEVLTDDTVAIEFQVKDLSIFKNEDLGLGPHLHVLLDNQPYKAVYDASKPLVLENLSPGTHTIRAFASRPWHESFKNEGAYTQTTFHIFTKTGDNSPDPNLPLLTYSRPQASYGAEPIMLDFYLTNAPLHLVAREDKQDDIADWRIRCTVNGDRFVLDEWQPIYLRGFKRGKNWVQIEFLDENGNPVKNAFNNTARLITYEPGGKDTLSKLMRGELNEIESRGIVDPNYTPPAPEPTPSIVPSPIAKPSPTPSPVVPVPQSTPAPSLSPVPEVEPSIAPSPTPDVEKIPQPEPHSAPFPVVSEPVLPKPESSEVIEPPAVEVEPEVEPTEVEPTPAIAPKPKSGQAASPIKNLWRRFRPDKAIESTPPQAAEPAPIPATVEIVPPVEETEEASLPSPVDVK